MGHVPEMTCLEGRSSASRTASMVLRSTPKFYTESSRMYRFSNPPRTMAFSQRVRETSSIDHPMLQAWLTRASVLPEVQATAK